MNIMRIISKEFKHNIRNWKANSMMILFPILLIIILGSAFTSVFSSNIELDDVKVLYSIRSGEYLAESFKAFSGELHEELGISFEETDDIDAGMAAIKDTKYTCYVILGSDPEKVLLYKNERFNFEANFVEMMMQTYTQRYSALEKVYKYNPAVLQQVAYDEAMDFVTTQSVDQNRTPTSLDYYSVTMLTLIILYSSLTGLWGVRNELTQKTGSRMLCSPVRSHEILIGKVIGGIIVTIVQVSLVIMFSRFVLNAYWGQKIFPIIAVVTAEAVMAVSIGAGAGYMFKNDGAANGILNTIIPIFTLLGGGYTPLSVMGDVMMKLSVISPVKWVNDAIFRVVYDNDSSLVLQAVVINLAIAAAFITISALISRKEGVRT